MCSRSAGFCKPDSPELCSVREALSSRLYGEQFVKYTFYFGWFFHIRYKRYGFIIQQFFFKAIFQYIVIKSLLPYMEVWSM
ncbi:MAG: hypothetical protein ACI3X4_01205 [Bacteroidaceae bacterium]